MHKERLVRSFVWPKKEKHFAKNCWANQKANMASNTRRSLWGMRTFEFFTPQASGLQIAEKEILLWSRSRALGQQVRSASTGSKLTPETCWDAVPYASALVSKSTCSSFPREIMGKIEAKINILGGLAVLFLITRNYKQQEFRYESVLNNSAISKKFILFFSSSCTKVFFSFKLLIM